MFKILLLVLGIWYDVGDEALEERINDSISFLLAFSRIIWIKRLPTTAQFSTSRPLQNYSMPLLSFLVAL
ncbi:hypothetical protein BHU16_01905 [Tannerella sp. oral taxon 808]|nr:hypothetical protein BHU16_01905 [Tannerella sp. oral taxon 808]